MLDALKFVIRASAKRAVVQSHLHFGIVDGYIAASNGVFSAGAPFAFDIACNPEAKTFLKAIEACNEESTFSILKTGKLSIKAGKFRAQCPILPGPYPVAIPAGPGQPFDGEGFMAAAKRAYPLIGDGLSHAWANGLLCLKNRVYATNNRIAGRFETGQPLPFIANLPRAVVAELIDVDAPARVTQNSHSVTFHWNDGRWLTTVLMPLNWPDVESLIGNSPGHFQPVNAEFFGGIATVSKVQPGMIRIRPGRIENDTASVDIDNLNATGAFDPSELLKLKGIADEISFNGSKPSRFKGTMCEGIISGMKDETQ